jgi:hypothetical protein
VSQSCQEHVNILVLDTDPWRQSLGSSQSGLFGVKDVYLFSQIPYFPQTTGFLQIFPRETSGGPCTSEEMYSKTGGQASKATPKGAMAKFAESGKLTAKKAPRNGTVGAEWVGWEDRGKTYGGGPPEFFGSLGRVFLGQRQNRFQPWFGNDL